MAMTANTPKDSQWAARNPVPALILLVVGLLVFLGAFGKGHDQDAAATKKYRPNLQTWAVLDQDIFACLDWDAFQSLTNIASSGDRRAFIVMAAVKCTPLHQGETVYIEDGNIWRGAYRVRPRGSIASYWIPGETSMKPTAGGLAAQF
jgi:hypothetical protein